MDTNVVCYIVLITIASIIGISGQCVYPIIPYLVIVACPPLLWVLRLDLLAIEVILHPQTTDRSEIIRRISCYRHFMSNGVMQRIGILWIARRQSPPWRNLELP